MKRVLAAIGCALALITGYAEAESYAPLVEREIKALSSDEIREYRAGAGRKQALAAELNGYPGPRHVLDLAPELGLTETQITQTRRARERMHEEAIRWGITLIEAERELDRAFAAGSATPGIVEALVYRIGELRAKVRLAHLQAHVAARGVLTEDQLSLYSQLRGYVR